MDGHSMMAHFRDTLRSEIKEPIAKVFADVKTSIDNVRRDVERHEGRLNNMEQSVPSGPKRASDKICVTIGGWDRDTPRDTILNETRSFTHTIPDKAEDGVFVPVTRASFLKVRFTSSGRMWAWARSMKKGKHVTMPQPHHLGRRFWFSVEKPSEEIRLSMVITRARKELADNLLVQAAGLELDYIRGITWWNQRRFGDMARTTGLMSFKEHVSAEIGAHMGVQLSLVDFQAKKSEEQMSSKLSWNAQGIAKHDAEYFAVTLREQHDYDGKTTKLEAGEGDLYLVTPRVERQEQM
ncbi:unnamed protein product [Prorocentrum cordatum]|uniref:Uncharacterized protein n=1 Tax=Prorocentrum cordatum TaxID=2364126 RepID=A0ABN9UGZ3_9DINO|nr:unnamed protein product [Polarella glacialis]